jgi:DNA-binding NtrC family response regulator
LDEVAEIGLDIQAKLLRAIDTGEISVVGESKPVIVDVRIICATNRNLKELVKQGMFREDLYYRLCGATIITKPLKERIEDIPLLVYSVIDNLNEIKKKNYKVTLKAIEYLQKHTWPGNVRELKHTIVTLAEISSNKIIDYEDVAKFLDIKQDKSPLSYKESKQLHIRNFDKEYFTTLLAITNGKLSECLKISGLHKKNFYDKLKNCGLKK